MRLLVKSQKPDMLCVQETKMLGIDRNMCSTLWEGDDFDWKAKDAEGRSGGLWILWRKDSFVLESVFQGSNYLGLVRFWGVDKLQVTIINVYASCDLRGKMRLWEELLAQMVDRGEGRSCILGDFNSIKSPHERKGVAGHDRNIEMEFFGDFIAEAKLIDLPFIGRKFTWYKADGSAMSRLDRFLISEEWLGSWNNLSQWGLKRGVSDHGAVVLKVKEINWGPKPFRMLKCWEEMEGYEEFVKAEWVKLGASGWKGYVLKEKLKGMKLKLKGWNKNHLGNLDTQISEAKEKLLFWDLKSESIDLTDEEIMQRRSVWEKFIVCLLKDAAFFGKNQG